jgi:hypothetical protein
MRIVMFVLAAAVAFVVWDGLANNGRYVNSLARQVSGREVAGGDFQRPQLDLSPAWKKSMPW